MAPQINHEAIAKICQKYHAEYLGIFGSAIRSDFNETSDVDLLVRFLPDSKIGLFKMSSMRNELQDVFNRKVDLLTEGFLSKYFRQEVLAQTQTIYAKA